MRLTKFTDYSIRALVYLSLQQERLATIAEIAKVYDISENHMTKVVHQLGLGGFIQTVRGKGGGMRLARTPEKINIGKVIRFTENQTGFLPCTTRKSDCCIQSACNLVEVLREAQVALFSIFDKYTLADLLHQREKKLASILLPERGTRTKKPVKKTVKKAA
ncbi:MAG: Rrf2 family transcriptional regulator [Methylobacillus sp.]|jgi:Rrf2 family nitric oxide-sensitive transcriptional repressor|nr:Rrf2 family transcriptional regulator [Methylobacillus sp.]